MVATGFFFTLLPPFAHAGSASASATLNTINIAFFIDFTPAMRILPESGRMYNGNFNSIWEMRQVDHVNMEEIHML
jgi:hypothetical protein